MFEELFHLGAVFGIGTNFEILFVIPVGLGPTAGASIGDAQCPMARTESFVRLDAGVELIESLLEL